MKSMMNPTGKAESVPKGMAISVFASMLSTLVMSAVIAVALNNETITWKQAGFWIMGMLFVASFIGGKSACLAIKRQRFVVSVMSGILYWGTLLCITALFFGGKFGAVLETAGVIGAGSCTSALILLPNPDIVQRRRRPTTVKLNKKQGRVNKIY